MRTHDATAEAQAIKSICDSEHRSTLLSRVGPDYFGSDTAQEIYARITTYLTAGKAIPSSQVLRFDQSLSEGARAFLSADSIAPLQQQGDLEAIADTLAYYRKGRILLAIAEHMMGTLKEEKPDIDTTISAIETTIQQCHSGSKLSEMTHYCAENAEALAQQTRDDMEREDLETIPTSITDFDEKSGGWRRSNLVAMSSVRGGGKSALALQAAGRQAMMGHRVCFTSFEMEEIEIRYRLLAQLSKVDVTKITLKRLNANHKRIINEAWYEFLSSLPRGAMLTIWRPRRDLDMLEISTELKPYAYDVVYVDYIGLLKENDRLSQQQQLGNYARHAKMAAGAQNNVYVLLCQFDEKEQKIKYSKAIEAHADFIWAWENGEREKTSNILEVKQLKARGAAEYPFYLLRNFSIMTFSDYTGPPPIKEREDDKPKKSGNTEIPPMPQLE